ncbi:hypothetical protein [Stackebrandtia soli]|uniref:LppU/SCO3897 family protein n=1 Tax=Stackebrandtia soli TaxID=1892856 RepID=UPI0039EC52D6
MSSDSGSEDTGKMLGIIASVIGILAFFGISNCDDLKNAMSSSESPGDGDIGDCVYARRIEEGAGIDMVLVDCDDSKANGYIYEIVWGTIDENRCPDPGYGRTRLWYWVDSRDDAEDRVMCAYWTK